MVARLVPDGEDGVSPAESLVLRALRDQLPDGTTVLVNLRMTDESGDREADAVVVWPGVGVAVVEVKGGHVGYADGQWWLGERRKPRRIDPVRQTRGCKYRIREVLRRHPRWSGGNPRMVHHVVLPFTRLPKTFTVAECPRELVTDQDQMDGLAERLRTQLDSVQPAPQPLGPAHATSLVAALTGPQRPQIDLVARVAAEVDERATACELLTARQARVLDLLRLQQRVQVLGGAGTGKTWLAVEQARRLAVDGLRVALLCYSRGLARWLRRRVDQLPAAQRPAWTGTYHGLGIRWGAPPREDAPPSFYETDLPAQMAELAGRLRPHQRFDALVVDEAQDFAASWWPPLLAALADPAAGRVVVFADEGQKVFSRGALLGQEFTSVVLDENLRDTEPIAQAFACYAARPVVPRGGHGAAVRWVPCAESDAVAAADTQVQRLLDEGWAPEHVMLLTTGSRHPEHVSRLEHAGRAGYWDSFWDAGDVFYGHVLNTKRLERPAVVLAVNGFREAERERELRYVGMSRARDLLVVSGPR